MGIFLGKTIVASQYLKMRYNLMSMLAFIVSGLTTWSIAKDDLMAHATNKDAQGCVAALDALAKTNRSKEDVAFYFGYLSGRLEVTLPENWKRAFLGRDFNSNELYRSKAVYAEGQELSKNMIASLGIESFVSNREDYYDLVSDQKSQRNVMYFASVFQGPSPFLVHCIDKDSKEVRWSREILSHLRGYDPCGPDYHYVEFANTDDNIVIFGFSGTQCYIERIDTETGETNFKMSSKMLKYIK
jgi:hypothetical protein